MSVDCQFPGCENAATATYCEECRLAVRGPRTSRRDWRGDARAAAGLFLYVPILIIGREMFTFAQSVSRTLQRWFA